MPISLRLVDHQRLNSTLRAHISRLVRKSLAFSKKVENHIGACGTSSITTMLLDSFILTCEALPVDVETIV